MNEFRLVSADATDVLASDALELYLSPAGTAIIWVTSVAETGTYAGIALSPEQLRELSAAALEAADELENR